MAADKAGQPITLLVLRAGKRIERTVKAGVRRGCGGDSGSSCLGFDVSSVRPVMITGFIGAQGKAAQAAGLRAGDAIVELAVPTRLAKHVTTAVMAVPPGTPISVTAQRARREKSRGAA